MKKLVSLVMSIAIATSFALPAFADNSTNSGICGLPLAPSTASYTMSSTMSSDTTLTPEIEPVSALLSSIQVKVSSPCDASWRSSYPTNWMYQADSAIESADNWLYTKFGIDFISVAQKEWTSPSSGTYTDYLDDAISDFGCTDGAQIMIAFSGVSASTVNAGGAAYLNSRHCIVFDQGSENNAKVIRHETGHLYGCPDEYNTATGQYTSKECLMNNCYQYSTTVCSDCYTIWDGNKNTK